MKILDRYILKKFLTSFAFILLIIVAVITLIDFAEKNEDFIKNNLTYQEILDYYLGFIPFIANFITPIAVFITTVFVTSKLAQNTEIVAILSGGVSFRRLMIPYFIGAGFIALVSFFLTGWIIADANKKKVTFELQYIDRVTYNHLKNIHIKIAKNSYIYVENYNNYNNIGFNFSLETIQNNQLIERLSARKIKWVEEKEKWEVSEWMNRKIHGLTEQVTMGRTLDITLNVFPKDFVNMHKLSETLTIPELNAYIEALKSKGADNIHIFLVEKYVRYMSPFAAVILTFIGLLASCRKVRGGVGFQIAMGFILAFVYIALFILSKGTAEAGSSNPLLTVWTPNIIFSILGIILYKFTPK